MPRKSNFHTQHQRRGLGRAKAPGKPNVEYSFEPFFHPFVGDLLGQLNRTSLAETLAPNFIAGLTRDYPSEYTKGSGVAIDLPAPGSTRAGLAIATSDLYSVYDWELLYHIPVTIGVHLSSLQRFEEAQKWFHLVFDPSFTDAGSSPAYPYWKCYALRNPQVAEATIGMLDYTGSDPALQAIRSQVVAGYNALLARPFDPFVVARSRPQEFGYFVFMKYLDNLIAWGDKLFMQFTIEALNEATLCYVLASNLLGPKPQQLSGGTTASPKSYADLSNFDALGNALVDLEAQLPFLIDPAPSSTGTASGLSGPLFGQGQTLYFCIPPNEKLLAYWDIVADRLFKIRHCQNISGVVQQLPLFDPPLDPGMLVKAAAAGIDVSSIVNGLNQPIGPVRAHVRIQKALELAAEVRTMGSALLAALEKGDAEHLALLRQTNEVELQQLTQNVRFLQLQQAKETTTALLRTRSVTLERYKYYLRMLGATPDTQNVPDTFSIAGDLDLTEDNWDDMYSALVDQFDKTISLIDYPALQLDQSSSPSNQSGATGTGQLYLNRNEATELNVLLPSARDLRTGAAAVNIMASIFTLIPEIGVDLAFWGLGADSKVFGGSKLSDMIKVQAEVMQTYATLAQDQAGMASRTASYQRRADEWIHQANLAARELMQIGRQIISSVIAQQVSQHDYQLAQKQIEQSQTVQTYMQEKFTSERLYLWMQGQLSSLYYQYYRLAFDAARKAEQTMKQELMRPELDATSFVQFNYWDTGYQGLLSGEALYLDVKRMDVAYCDNNKRELELTRHISLRQLNPMALITLRTTGACSFTIPEWFFDRECPGHFMRRLKHFALSLPSVVGPYTNVHCTVTQQSSRVRVSSLPDKNTGKYAWQDSGDERFVEYFGSNDIVVISSGSNDAGMFEASIESPKLRDDVLFPFEGTGVCDSVWRLGLPTDFPPFDRQTIPDVILHLRYTARPAGADLSELCVKELKQQFKTAGSTNLTSTSNLSLLFMLRSDFSSEWAAFVANKTTFNFTLRIEHFPYFVQAQIDQGSKLVVNQLLLYADDLGPANPQPDMSALATTLKAVGANGSAQLALNADAVVLKPDSSQVYLFVSYSVTT